MKIDNELEGVYLKSDCLQKGNYCKIFLQLIKLENKNQSFSNSEYEIYSQEVNGIARGTFIQQMLALTLLTIQERK